MREKYIKSVEQRLVFMKTQYEKQKEYFQLFCQTEVHKHYFETNAIRELTEMREAKIKIEELESFLEMLKIEE